MQRNRFTSAFPILAASAFAACAVKEAPNTAATDTGAVAAANTVVNAATPATGPNLVHVTAKDFSFDAPATIPAGLTTLHLMNEGKEVHQAQIIKLTDGKTYDDFMAALKAMKPNQPPPSWVVPYGGPNAAVPGGTAAATSTLEAGNYALVCFIPSSDGQAHAMKGMSRGLVVTPSTAASAPEPTPTTTLTLADYKFVLSQPLKAGENVVRVENSALQPHEVALFKLLPGKTMKDMQAWLPVSDKQASKAPGIPVGGVVGQVKGEHAFFTATLDAGDYVMVCFLPDSKDGKPHFVHGMVQEFKVT
jgi:hypothetical protein